MLEIVCLILGIISVVLGLYSPVRDAWRQRQRKGEPSESDASLTTRYSPGEVETI